MGSTRIPEYYRILFNTMGSTRLDLSVPVEIVHGDVRNDSTLNTEKNILRFELYYSSIGSLKQTILVSTKKYENESHKTLSE